MAQNDKRNSPCIHFNIPIPNQMRRCGPESWGQALRVGRKVGESGELYLQVDREVGE